jgi:DNA-binding NarL/FixJ family response regulator
MTATTARVTVLVVDDHRTVAELLALGIDREPDLDCVGFVVSAPQAMAEFDRLQPDVVVVDVNLGDDDGLALTKSLLDRRRETRVVVLTGLPQPSLVSRAAEAGAGWLLAKDGSLPDLLHAIRSSVPGGFAVEPALLKKLLTRPDGSKDVPAPATLSPRERDVLQGLGRGHSTRAIAEELGISVNTCRGYVKSLMTKLGAHSQLEAVLVANRTGLIDAQAE